jgi:hypothetical protein
MEPSGFREAFDEDMDVPVRGARIVRVDASTSMFGMCQMRHKPSAKRGRKLSSA